MALQFVGRNSCSSVLRRLPSVVDCQPIQAIAGILKLPVATMRATFGEKFDYAEPYPYEKTPFDTWATGYEYTKWRFLENSKVVIVDGNIGVGKTEFAKRLAKRFDLRFIPTTRENQLFLHKDYNYDTRGFDELLPETCRSYDSKKFYADPHPEKGTVGKTQLLWYRERFADYMLALRHIMNTGQGVVLARCVYSDIVFVDALKAMGWITPNFANYYQKVRTNTICELFRPHLTIYLDAPISVLRERIAQRNTPGEVGSRNLTDEYLKAIDDAYQQRYLPKMRESGEVAEIDWTEVANDDDMDMIAEEIQAIKLEGIDNDDPHFFDWVRIDEDDLRKFRLHCEDLRWQYELFAQPPPPWECPECMPSADDSVALEKFSYTHPAVNYRPGWCPDFGHKVLFKF